MSNNHTIDEMCKWLTEECILCIRYGYPDFADKAKAICDKLLQMEGTRNAALEEAANLMTANKADILGPYNAERIRSLKTK